MSEDESLMQSGPADDEISVFDALLVLAKRKMVVLGLPFVAAVLAMIYSLQLPNIYTGIARVLPPQQGQSGLLGGLGGLYAQSIASRTQTEMYAGMLQSRSVADGLIKRFDLQKLYQTHALIDTRAVLAGVTNIRAGGRDGIISIEVDDKDPQRAAALANAYVEELGKLLQRIAVTDAGQRRVYLEKQLQQAKDQLADAEVALRKMQEETGLIQLQEQGRAIIEAVGSLRGQIAAKEVQLSSMRTFATNNNPDYIRIREEIAGLRSELAKLEKATPEGSRDLLIPSGRVPEAGLQYVRRLREVKYHETLFELIAKQYEIAKADEAKDSGGGLQVVDAAVPPDRKSKPKRSAIVIVWTLSAAFIAVLWVFAAEALERARRDPDSNERLNRLRRSLAWRWRKRS